ncbi:hypothetical protein [Lactobacillus sp. UCMA15818]|uniref:hypothetical protein n=1 Tax=Lactobacillus sp. UCMA15818 TaxID=2583394 RepID=UPI0025B04F70|nr:hypothetical protein [Lactobacillus sp. UCMA15818]
MSYLESEIEQLRNSKSTANKQTVTSKLTDDIQFYTDALEQVVIKLKNIAFLN